jgi:hypothetical protein
MNWIIKTSVGNTFVHIIIFSLALLYIIVLKIGKIYH